METILDPKTQLLVAMGAAVAAKCQTCFAKLYGMVGEVGVSDTEVRAVVAISNKVAHKSRDFMAAFVEQTTKGVVGARMGGAEDAGCGCR